MHMTQVYAHCRHQVVQVTMATTTNWMTQGISVNSDLLMDPSNNVSALSYPSCPYSVPSPALRLV